MYPKLDTLQNELTLLLFLKLVFPRVQGGAGVTVIIYRIFSIPFLK